MKWLFCCCGCRITIYIVERPVLHDQGENNTLFSVNATKRVSIIRRYLIHTIVGYRQTKPVLYANPALLKLFSQSETALISSSFLLSYYFLLLFLRPNCIARIARYDQVTSRIHSNGDQSTHRVSASTQRITWKRIIDFHESIQGNKFFFLSGAHRARGWQNPQILILNFCFFFFFIWKIIPFR